MELKKKLTVVAFGVLAAGGIGAGVANAATPAATPPAATSSAAVDTPTLGDTADKAGAAEKANGPDTDNVQQGGQSGDQSGPDTGAPEAPETATGK